MQHSKTSMLKSLTDIHNLQFEKRLMQVMNTSVQTVSMRFLFFRLSFKWTSRMHTGFNVGLYCKLLSTI